MKNLTFDILQAVKELVNNYSPKKITLDFEIAIWKSAAKYFPESELKGCLFHWTQAVHRKIQVYISLLVFHKL